MYIGENWRSFCNLFGSAIMEAIERNLLEVMNGFLSIYDKLSDQLQEGQDTVRRGNTKTTISNLGLLPHEQ
jgi:hypothetical protein